MKGKTIVMTVEELINMLNSAEVDKKGKVFINISGTRVECVEVVRRILSGDVEIISQQALDLMLNN